MHEFICERCGYSTHLKYNFRKHLTKKYICPPKRSTVTREHVLTKYGLDCSKWNVNVFTPNVNATTAMERNIIEDNNSTNDIPLQHICIYCNKLFNTRQSKYQHQNRHCKHKPSADLHIQQEKRIDELTTQVHSLLQVIMDTSSDTKPKHITNHNNNITNNNLTNNITNTNNTQLQINNQINNYGNEDTSYITKEKYKEILKNPFTSLSKLINEVHFNDEHPENKNMRIPNKKQPFVEFYDDGWVIGNQYKFVCKLFFIKKELLHEVYLEVEDILDEKTKEAYRHFREETTLNPKTVESQLKDIQAAIMSGTRRRMEYLQQHPPTT